MKLLIKAGAAVTAVIVVGLVEFAVFVAAVAIRKAAEHMEE